MRHQMAILSILLLVSASAEAVDRSFEMEVENDLKNNVPPNWFLRATWRDKTLVLFFSPPTPKSFELWYDADRQKSMMGDLCKAVPRTIWDRIGADRDISVEQVVGGNGGKGSWRLSCRAYLTDQDEQKTTN